LIIARPIIGKRNSKGFTFHLVAITPIEIEYNIAAVVIIVFIPYRVIYRYVM
jgi:hypothetical protein